MQSVYGLVDPRTEEVFYIGIAEDIHRRYAQHLIYPHKNEAKDRRMAELKAAGLLPALIIIEADIEDTLIHRREKYWIDHYWSKGAPLTNIIYVKRNRGFEHKEDIRYDWMSAKKAIELLSSRTDRPVSYAYLKRMAEEGKVAVKQLDLRTKLYRREDLMLPRVKQRGDGSVRRTVRKDAREKAAREQEKAESAA